MTMIISVGGVCKAIMICCLTYFCFHSWFNSLTKYCMFGETARFEGTSKMTRSRRNVVKSAFFLPHTDIPIISYKNQLKIFFTTLL